MITQLPEGGPQLCLQSTLCAWPEPSSRFDGDSSSLSPASSTRKVRAGSVLSASVSLLVDVLIDTEVEAAVVSARVCGLRLDNSGSSTPDGAPVSGTGLAVTVTALSRPRVRIGF
jgi:hypothetical protein